MAEQDRESRKPALANKVAAEAVATFMVTATAIGVDVLYYTGAGVDSVSRWLARGFIASAVIYAFAETSGAHANPAVTLAFALRRIFPLGLTAAYMAAQFAGGFAAAALYLAFVGAPAVGLGTSHPGAHFSPVTAAVAEAVLTFAVAIVILMTAQEEAVVGKHAALAVGFVIAACGFVAGPISGASMNPARTVAPEILVGSFSHMWIYIAGPVLGAVAAVIVHAALCGPPSRGERKAARGK